MRHFRIPFLSVLVYLGLFVLSVGPASAVGLSDPSALTKHDGGMTVTTDGAVIENLEITGTLRIEANNVIVRNVWVYGSEFWHIYVASGSATVSDSEIGHASHPASRGIGGHNIVGTRLDIHDVEDGIKLGSNSVFSNVRIHDLNSAGSGPHYDAVQVEGTAHNSTVKNSYLSSIGPDGIGNGAVLAKSRFGSQSNITFSNNYMEGGNYTIFVRDGGHGVPKNVAFIGNRFGRTMRYGLTSLDGPIVWENNTWADTGEFIDAQGNIIDEGSATTTTTSPPPTTTTTSPASTTTTSPASTTTTSAATTTTTTSAATTTTHPLSTTTTIAQDAATTTTTPSEVETSTAPTTTQPVTTTTGRVVTPAAEPDPGSPDPRDQPANQGDTEISATAPPTVPTSTAGLSPSAFLAVVISLTSVVSYAVIKAIHVA